MGYRCIGMHADWQHNYHYFPSFLFPHFLLSSPLNFSFSHSFCNSPILGVCGGSLIWLFSSLAEDQWKLFLNIQLLHGIFLSSVYCFIMLAKWPAPFLSMYSYLDRYMTVSYQINHLSISQICCYLHIRDSLYRLLIVVTVIINQSQLSSFISKILMW